jgi:hypothetical protein
MVIPAAGVRQVTDKAPRVCSVRVSAEAASAVWASPWRLKTTAIESAGQVLSRQMTELSRRDAAIPGVLCAGVWRGWVDAILPSRRPVRIGLGLRPCGRPGS